MNKWVTDANQMEINKLDDLIFKNGLINSYLKRADSYFLSANKGMGKTLLLTYKRFLINKNYEERRKKGDISHSVKFIPENRPYLDTMGDINDIAADKLSFLSNITDAKKLWVFCLKLSAIAAIFGYKELKSDSGLLKKLPSDVRDLIEDKKYLPTYFFSQLLNRTTYSQLKQLFIETDVIMNSRYQSIKSGLFMFIDKVDQSISNLPQEAWINTQAGLIEAAWDLMGLNHHVKIYSSIRQEAFSNYNSAQKENLENFVKTIKYDNDDIVKIIDKLTKSYEGKSSFKDFIGMDVVMNGGGKIEEDSFKYLLRHTTGRPRELVSIISGISDEIDDMTDRRFKEIVNDKGSLLIPQRFSETRTFLNCLHDEGKRQRFFSLIPHNILTRKETEEICCEFNDVDWAYFDQLKAPRSEIYHPFCDLYSCGLLGTIDTDRDNQNIMYFKQPKDILKFYPALMPNAELYFVHPSLERLIKASSQSTYRTFDYLVVGHQYRWDKVCKGIYLIQRECFDIMSDRFKELVNQLLHVVVNEQNPGKTVHSIYEKLVAIEEQNPNDGQKHVIFYVQEYFFD